MIKSGKAWRLGLLLISVLVAAVLLVGCSGSSAKGGIDVTLSTYKIQMASNTAPAGEITFHIKNSATDMKHEFVIFKTDLDAASLPTDSDGNVVEDQLTSVDEAELDPGKSSDLTVNLQPGHYAIVCNQPGHFKQGMYTDFTVQ